MSVIMCNINMFAADQQVMIFNDDASLEPNEVIQVPLKNIVDILPELCYNNNINDIHFFGPADYCNGLAQQIVINDKEKYSNMTINIEVN